MAKVKDLLGQRPVFPMQSLDLDTIDINKIWVNYDIETDSMVIYITGRPQPAVSVYTDHNIYVMADPKTRTIVGFHVEKWERKFVPVHADIQEAWTEIKKSFDAGQSWSHLLRMLALWTIFTLKSNHSVTSVSQPV